MSHWLLQTASKDIFVQVCHEPDLNIFTGKCRDSSKHGGGSIMTCCGQLQYGQENRSE